MVGDLSVAPRFPAGAYAETNIFQRGEPGQQTVVLEHHAALEAWAADLFVLHHQGPFGELIQPGERVHDGGFTAARVADDAHEFAFLELKTDVLEHRQRFGFFTGTWEALGSFLYLYERMTHGRLLIRRK